MHISSRPIGPNHPPYIIAELGVNHDGSAERALQLTRAAAEAGAEAVKLQLFEADRLMSRAAKLAAYQKAAGESDPVEMLRRLELTIDQMEPIVRLAHELGIHAIVTVFSLELVEAAERLPWDAYKTASPDIIHKPLLEALATTGKPIIVSTGASTIDEVERAADWLTDARARLAFLQCVSCYPTPWDQAELGGIAAIAHRIGGPVGYSDHTHGIGEGLQAVLCGAQVLEKHLTYDRKAAGPDHKASLEPLELATYVQVAGVPHALRTGGPLPGDQAAKERWRELRPPEVEAVKRVLPIEQDVRAVSRQSITTTRALPAGHTLTRADLTFKRPGTGIPPWRLDEILGRPLARPVETDTPLTDADLDASNT